MGFCGSEKACLEGEGGQNPARGGASCLAATTAPMAQGQGGRGRRSLTLRVELGTAATRKPH
jgi:hypothetical protein